MQQLIELYKDTFGVSPLKVETLAKAGSNRRYIRMTGPKSVIGVIGTDRSENQAFIYLARHFAEKGIPVPAIYGVSEDEMRYLQEDLGTVALYNSLSHGRENSGAYNVEEIELLKRTIRHLPHIQIEGAEELNFNKLLQPISFTEQAAKFDLHYFKYCFLKTTDLPYDEVRMEADFEAMARDLVACAEGHVSFLYRDFQARNVMLKEEGGTLRPYFIDFQGGQQGPIHYDVASFLWQASARYSQELRNELIKEYMDELSKLVDFNQDSLLQHLRLFVLFRLMQVLGAYGLRGYFERKKYFIDSIPYAINNLRQLLNEGVAAPYPYMEETLRRLVALQQFEMPEEKAQRLGLTASTSKYDGKGPLVVRVFSFSYKKGIPEDTSGNGGGYVFDCRSTHNPGRYEPYKKITGLDPAVIQFLEEDGEILTFLDSVYQLADAHCARYIKRGFTDLMFSFGCTGGQHRSVYSAQHLAEHLNEKFGIEVRIEHREQGIKQTLPAKK